MPLRASVAAEQKLPASAETVRDLAGVAEPLTLVQPTFIGFEPLFTPDALPVLFRIR
jgi:hypothetical protein